VRWITAKFVFVCRKMSRNDIDSQPARAGSFFFKVLMFTRWNSSWREKDLRIWQTFELITDFGGEHQGTGVAEIVPAVWEGQDVVYNSDGDYFLKWIVSTCYCSQPKIVVLPEAANVGSHFIRTLQPKQGTKYGSNCQTWTLSELNLTMHRSF